MRAESLPPEVWRSVVLHLDDRCHAWFVMRRVSRSLRQITEDVFAKHIISESAITLINSERPNILGSSLLFQATNFTPADTKEKAVFKPFQEKDKQFFQCGITEENFWAAMSRDVAQSQHFVRLERDLRMIRLPSAELVDEFQELGLSLDWRLLCQQFYYDELKTRRATKPFLREFSMGEKEYPLELLSVYKLMSIPGYRSGHHISGGPDLPAECQQDGWIFWDAPRTGRRVFLVENVILGPFYPSSI